MTSETQRKVRWVFFSFRENYKLFNGTKRLLIHFSWRDTCDGKQFVIMWSDHTWETIRCPFTDYWIGKKSYKQYMELNKVVSGKMSKEKAMKFINEKFESFR